CVFCNLKTEYLYEDKTFVCFKDKYPASDTHLLLIPREHIRDAKHLTKSDIPMIQKMIAIGEQLAQERGL
ncbi:HIT-like domain-containing protein, partial [Gorgonomyces haynaldii]